MPATSRTAENTSVDNGPQQDYRPVTTKGRPMTTKGRPVTTKSRRPQQGSVDSLSSRMSSGSHKDQDGSKSIPGSDEKNDKRLLNRSRAQTSPSSKYHSSCSSSSSASSDSLNSSTSSFRPRTVQSYPSPDTINLTCRVSNNKPGYYEFLRPYSAYTPPLWKEPKLPQAFRDSKKLNHSSLTEGERFYLWRTATVYGLTDMKKQNQLRYEKLLRHTVETGFHTEEEVQKYMNYFKGTRKRQFKADPSVWRAPPRIPVRPLHFRKPPTSPRGWNSYSPQGTLGRGRSLKTTPSSGKNDDTKDVKQGKVQQRNDKTPNTKPADENDKENNQEDEQQKKTELVSAEQEGKNEEQPPPKIYYDMKLRRTVIRPDTGNDGKEAEEDSKTNSAKKTLRQDKGASLKDKNKSKDSKSNSQNPRPPSPPKLSWEDKEKREAEYSARPKTSRRRPQRATAARQKGDRMRADDSEEDTDIGRKSSTFSTTSSGSSSGSSSSGSSSNSGSSSSRSSSGISRSSSSKSNSTIKGDNSPSRPKVKAAVGNKAWEGDNDDARAALARSFWNGSKGKGHKNGESSQASSNKYEIASTSSPSKNTTGSDGNSSGSGTSRSSSSQGGVKGHEEGESSQYSEETWEQDSDDARAAMAQSFWGKK